MSTITVTDKPLVAFDLDDTLVKEMDYVRSAYREISRLYGRDLLPKMLNATSVHDAFESTGLPIDTVLEIYRNHLPDIRLPWQSLFTLSLLKNLGCPLALITDGRSVTQRHKIEALGLQRFIPDANIYVSGETGHEKTDGHAFRDLMTRIQAKGYWYVGDNPAKDFEMPAELGWTTVSLRDNGQNIHAQELNHSGAQFTVNSLTELPILVV